MWKRPKIKHGKPTKWLWTVWHPEYLSLGDNTDIGAYTAIFAHYGVYIGKNAQLGSHVSVYSYSSIDNKRGYVFIGENARVGTHSTVMPGVSIGKNALVAAHSFVNKNVPEGAFAYGVPIRIER